MPRKRDLRPSFFTNEYLAELPFEARLLFAGLWTIADRRGRLEDRPLRIKGALFPYDNMDVNALLQMLADSEDQFIVRYCVDEKRYIQIVKFEKNQHVHKDETESVIPPPPEHHLEVVPPPPEHHPNTPSSLTTSSLTTSSLTASSSVASSQDVVVDARADAQKDTNVDFARICSHYAETFGAFAPPVAQAGIQGFLEHLEPDVIIDAIDETAVAENVQSKWKYLRQILDNRKSAGIKSMDDVRRSEAEREASKSASNRGRGQNRPQAPPAHPKGPTAAELERMEKLLESIKGDDP